MELTVVTSDPDSAQTGTSKPVDVDTKIRRAAAVDLALIIAFFVACYASMPVLDPILGNGRGLAMVFAIAAYQFSHPSPSTPLRSEKIVHACTELEMICRAGGIPWR